VIGASPMPSSRAALMGQGRPPAPKMQNSTGGCIMLNSKQVDQLFRQNAILFGNKDGVPKYLAVELFGKEAVDFTINSDWHDGYYNEYGIGNYDASYLTYRGFQEAATYVNIREIEAQESAKIKIEN